MELLILYIFPLFLNHGLDPPELPPSKILNSRILIFLPQLTPTKPVLQPHEDHSLLRPSFIFSWSTCLLMIYFPSQPILDSKWLNILMILTSISHIHVSSSFCYNCPSKSQTCTNAIVLPCMFLYPSPTQCLVSDLRWTFTITHKSFYLPWVQFLYPVSSDSIFKLSFVSSHIPTSLSSRSYQTSLFHTCKEKKRF